MSVGMESWNGTRGLSVGGRQLSHQCNPIVTLAVASSKIFLYFFFCLADYYVQVEYFSAIL